MKIYTNTFDLRQPTEKKFWVAPYSDFKIGIMVIGAQGTDNNVAASGIELYKDGKKLAVDSTDGTMAYWKIKSEDTGYITYTVKAKINNKVVSELKLTQVVTNSTVYEQESGGEIPSDLEVDSINVNDEMTIGSGCYVAKITYSGCGFFQKIDSTDANIGNLNVGNTVGISGCGITLTKNNNVIDLNPSYGIITSPVIKQSATNDDNGIFLENNNAINNDNISMIRMTGNYTGNQGCGALPFSNNFLYIENTYSEPVSFSVTNIDITAANAGGCTAVGTRTFDFKPTVITNIDGEKVIVLAAYI